MKHQTRLQILEEIAARVAEMNIAGNGHLSDDIIAKAFSLQTEKKRNEITKQSKPKVARKPKADLTQETIGEAIEAIKINYITSPVISDK